MLGGDSPSTPVRPREPESGADTPPPKPETKWTRGHIPGEVGIWVFIIGDMLVFSVFFGVFMVERGDNLEAFRAGRETLSTLLGTLNTLLLLTGSILVVLAMRAVRQGLSPRARRLLWGAVATGGLFVLNKVIEYGEKIADDLTPSTNDFYTLFFAFTGIHLLHLLIGIGVLLFMLRIARQPTVPVRDVGMMESGASFWHLVDLLWVVLFPLFYLVA